MTIGELQKKRAAFKAAVLSLLRDPGLSYREIGDRLGVSQWRVCQIRKEFGLPNRIGRRRPRSEASPMREIKAAEMGSETGEGGEQR